VDTAAVDASDSAIARDLERVIDRHGPAQVCATLAPFLTDERIARIDAVLGARLGSLCAVIEDAYDPHNAAAAVRTSEALGLSELHAITPGLPTASGFGGPRPNEQGQKLAVARGITRGCDRWLELVRWHTPGPCIAALRARGFAVYGTMPGARFDLESVPLDRPTAILFGNEHAGLSAEAVGLCDAAIGLPIFGFTESYNLSVTVALAMSRLSTRRRAMIDGPGDLAPEVRARLRARWFGLRLNGAAQILARLLKDEPASGDAAVSDGTHGDVATGPQPGENR
jgi:tRNA (guanosine-2'-O-)-methyltransferase